MHRHLRTAATTLILLGGLTGCANDLLTDSIQTSRDAKPNENIHAPKAEAVVRVAKATANSGNWPMAATLYRRAHILHPASLDAAIGLGTMLNKLGAHPEALSVFLKALKISPKNVTALRGTGNTLILSGQPANALEYFNKALALKEEPRLFNAVGVTYDMLDKYGMAQAYYRTGLKAAPGDLSLRNNLGLSLMLSDRTDEAVVELRKVARDRRANKRHQLNLVLALVMANELSPALSIAKMVLPTGEAQDQVTIFETIKGLGDPAAIRNAIRAHITGATTSNQVSSVR
ncbi:MAG: tetratricopeptide repeat protein [Alphaproteobacteria bacterium]|nr:tetratricopeptide repeat protein [Alphaproteobacteria bacterium]